MTSASRPAQSLAICARCLFSRRPYSSFISTSTFNRDHRWKRRSLHGSHSFSIPRKRDFFSSNAFLRSEQQPVEDTTTESQQQTQRKRAQRGLPAKTSLRRVAVEAQRSRDGMLPLRPSKDVSHVTKTVTAYCGAEQYDIWAVIRILRRIGYAPDPLKTGLYPQVVHIQVPVSPLPGQLSSDFSGSDHTMGDIFIFPSGTVVAWGVPENIAMRLVTSTLVPAAVNSHLEQFETEDLEYVEDPSRTNSSVKGDTIILGTKARPSEDGIAYSHQENADTQSQSSNVVYTDAGRAEVDTVLAKIAFSSGLARSTKLAVLESLLSNYFESTRDIPTMLHRGSRLPFTRAFILRKTGQLLSVRAQLNLYSELTDSLPDLFWDSRHELGLEGYYDQVGKALDVGVRIKVLNEKMDYAQEIASVLREQLSERHGLFLEWTIIALIAVEVGFEILRLWREKRERDEFRDSQLSVNK